MSTSPSLRLERLLHDLLKELDEPGAAVGERPSRALARSRKPAVVNASVNSFYELHEHVLFLLLNPLIGSQLVQDDHSHIRLVDVRCTDSLHRPCEAAPEPFIEIRSRLPDVSAPR